MKNIFKLAHKLTKEIKGEFPEVDYKSQFGICLKYIHKRMNEIKNKLGINVTEAINLVIVELSFQNYYYESDKINFNLWEKYGHKRVYINCPWRSKHNNKGNYFDLKNNKLIDGYVKINF